MAVFILLKFKFTRRFTSADPFLHRLTYRLKRFLIAYVWVQTSLLCSQSYYNIYLSICQAFSWFVLHAHLITDIAINSRKLGLNDDDGLCNLHIYVANWGLLEVHLFQANYDQSRQQKGIINEGININISGLGFDSWSYLL